MRIDKSKSEESQGIWLFVDIFRFKEAESAERDTCHADSKEYADRIVKDFVVQGGDFIFGNGKGSYSIYGETFPDENFRVNHNKEGILSMANTGPNTNGCQFFITLGKCPWLDGKHVAFGQVLDSNSMNIIKRISKVDVDEQSRPKIPVEIIQCGQM